MTRLEARGPRAHAHLALLRLFGRLPRPVRLAVMRAVTPGYLVGSLCLVERDDGARLLVRSSYRRHWGLPGGLARRGERIDHAAVRELREELGIEIELLGEPAVNVDPRARRVDVVYLARVLGAGPDEAAPPPTSPEVLEARWFPPDDLPPLQPESAEALVALARTLGARGRPPGRPAPGPGDDAEPLGPGPGRS